jgi:hypothetical protein
MDLEPKLEKRMLAALTAIREPTSRRPRVLSATP